MNFTGAVALVARLMEGAGVLTMLLGSGVAVWLALSRLRREASRRAFVSLRQSLGRAILLGLEFLVAADIIRTVSEEPTLKGVTVLAIIVAIRTFLSFTLEMEVEGRWPWQAGRPAVSGPALPSKEGSPGS
ncbi:MAG: DUF1622 domain-containing protein [Myxococcota bacterium]|nr:DUF1622 domain-containing protein [Myxococcota bacterium]